MKLSILLSFVIVCCLLTSAKAQGYDDIDTDSVFTEVEQQAQFSGGWEGMAEFLTKYMRYPYKSQKAGIQGTVFVSFIVNKDGSISDIAIAKSISEECGDEAIRMIEISPNWIPATRNGNPVRSRFIMPIKFTIN